MDAWPVAEGIWVHERFQKAAWWEYGLEDQLLRESPLLRPSASVSIPMLTHT